MSKYCLALVNIKGLGVKTFSYLIPDEMQDKLKIGQAILVPFGRQGLINAFCVGFSDYVPGDFKIKKINKILDEKPLFSLDYLKLLEWVANYYCTDLVTVLNAAIPLKLIEKAAKTEQLIEFVTFDGSTKRQAEVLELLKTKGKTPLIQFEREAKTTRTTIKKLEEAGCVKITSEELYRNPLDILKISEIEPLAKLSPEQERVYKGIKKSISDNTQPPKTILLHGVTASGKTEVYFKLIADTLKNNKNVLFLAPEIALASQLTKRLAKKFGTQDVAIWHSSISDGERFDVWQKLYKNEIKILAGARSAVFAPLQDIGLIIIDEEHEGAYKQTNPSPRYDARTVAKKLAELHKCPIILGSATPDISSYYNAINSNNLFELKTRYNDAKVPHVTVIDMKEYRTFAYRKLISMPLQTAIDEALENGKQVILLINRRGYSVYTQCQACGEFINCPNCKVQLVWHPKEDKLKCHYCGYTQSFPETCPKCGSDALRNHGTGVQKVEQFIKNLYPDRVVERIDSDILTRKGEHINILDRFTKGEIDILVGTQMIAKGLDNPNVTLVGVVSADAGFDVPDFRSSERGFQLLTQVAGRAGRGDSEGRVFFQTYNPEYYALESAKEQNYEKFYSKEIVAREEYDYPPFSQIIRLILTGENKFRVEKASEEINLRLCTMVDKYGISEYLGVLDATNCILEKINNQYRYHILIKNKMFEKGHMFISSFLNKITMPKDIKLLVDVDPLDIL